MSIESNIQKNIPLAPLTTFKIGGPAKYFTEVNTEEELSEAPQYAKKNNLKVFVLGGGSNILVSDQGFDGLVIRLLNSSFSILDSSIECGAGLSLSEAVRLSRENSLTGLEWAAGIPGTVGGAVFGNAGAFGKWMEDVVESVKVLEISDSNSKIKGDDGSGPQIRNCTSKECDFSYKESVFKKNSNLVIVSCVLKLEKGKKEEIETRMKEILEKRASGSHPNSKYPSAGSFFKNPVVENQKLIEQFEKEKNTKCQGNRLPAGWLIDEAGLRGKKIGRAMVSEEHANFVINLGGAKAEEIIILISYIKQKIRREFDVELEEEIQYIGF